MALKNNHGAEIMETVSLFFRHRRTLLRPLLAQYVAEALFANFPKP